MVTPGVASAMTTAAIRVPGYRDVHAHPSRRGVTVELRANRLRCQAFFDF